jgi:hypothetical protein
MEACEVICELSQDFFSRDDELNFQKSLIEIPQLPPQNAQQQEWTESSHYFPLENDVCGNWQRADSCPFDPSNEVLNFLEKDDLVLFEEEDVEVTISKQQQQPEQHPIEYYSNSYQFIEKDPFELNIAAVQNFIAVCNEVMRWNNVSSNGDGICSEDSSVPPAEQIHGLVARFIGDHLNQIGSQVATIFFRIVQDNPRDEEYQDLFDRVAFETRYVIIPVSLCLTSISSVLRRLERCAKRNSPTHSSRLFTVYNATFEACIAYRPTLKMAQLSPLIDFAVNKGHLCGNSHGGSSGRIFMRMLVIAFRMHDMSAFYELITKNSNLTNSENLFFHRHGHVFVFISQSEKAIVRVNLCASMMPAFELMLKDTVEKAKYRPEIAKCVKRLIIGTRFLEEAEPHCETWLKRFRKCLIQNNL